MLENFVKLKKIINILRSSAGDERVSRRTKRRTSNAQLQLNSSSSSSSSSSSNTASAAAFLTDFQVNIDRVDGGKREPPAGAD